MALQLSFYPALTNAVNDLCPSGVPVSVWGGCGMDRFDKSPNRGRLAEDCPTESPQLWHWVCRKKRLVFLILCCILTLYIYKDITRKEYRISFWCELFFPGIFPEPDKDPVIQIASMVQRQGETEPFIRTVFTLQSCASIVGSQILCFTQERQLLQVYSTSTSPENKETFALLFLLFHVSSVCAELGRVFEDSGPRHHHWIQHTELWLPLFAQQGSCSKG